MAKSAMIRVRTEPELKQEVEQIFKDLGMTTSEAINIFYKQVQLQKGIPFSINIPNKITLRTFKKTDTGEEIIKCKDAQDMFRKLGL